MTAFTVFLVCAGCAAGAFACLVIMAYRDFKRSVARATPLQRPNFAARVRSGDDVGEDRSYVEAAAEEPSYRSVDWGTPSYTPTPEPAPSWHSSGHSSSHHSSHDSGPSGSSGWGDSSSSSSSDSGSSGGDGGGGGGD